MEFTFIELLVQIKCITPVWKTSLQYPWYYGNRESVWRVFYQTYTDPMGETWYFVKPSKDRRIEKGRMLPARDIECIGWLCN